MPIVEAVAVDAPLEQGDILNGVPLFTTGENWGESTPCLLPAGEYPFALVISRNCICVNKPVLLVAAVARYVKSLPTDAKTTDEVVEFLTQMRDGDAAPDRFYLGQLPGDPNNRYCARLDSIHSVQVPRKRLDEELKSRRIGRISRDFINNLHRRIFSAVAQMGFDDYAWYSDKDLAWALATATAELTQTQAEFAAVDADKLANLKEHTRLSKKLEKLKPVQKAFADEQARRDAAKGKDS
jgi:hypothetical protein